MRSFIVCFFAIFFMTACVTGTQSSHTTTDTTTDVISIESIDTAATQKQINVLSVHLKYMESDIDNLKFDEAFVQETLEMARETFNSKLNKKAFSGKYMAESVSEEFKEYIGWAVTANTIASMGSIMGKKDLNNDQYNGFKLIEQKSVYCLGGAAIEKSKRSIEKLKLDIEINEYNFNLKDCKYDKEKDMKEVLTKIDHSKNKEYLNDIRLNTNESNQVNASTDSIDKLNNQTTQFNELNNEIDSSSSEEEISENLKKQTELLRKMKKNLDSM